ncbi:MAG: CXXX repeat peptide maturase [Bacteroidaceae bacterium]|nr:CXXX repeat peptide maturase [Bacteroidaceae bacterium]
MLQYLIILLDDASTSYCHYKSSSINHRLIDLVNLKAGIRFAMKENLMIQFVYSDSDLPREYKEVIETIDHSKIIPSTSSLVDDADVVVFNNWKDIIGYTLDAKATYVLRICMDDLFAQRNIIKTFIGKVARLNIVITDVEAFTENDMFKYQTVLDTFGKEVEGLFKENLSPQLNVITDRIALTQMNNCNAGSSNITLAPDGKFYICPAFYYDEDKETFCVGDLQNGLYIKAAKLYKLAYAPLCRTCDAYQCKRCVWINRKMTYDITTPSHEQCVLAHLERNASRKVLEATRTEKVFYPEQDIKEINYLDPFDVRIDWHKI